MKIAKYIILILLINTILLLFYGKPIIESDGLTYYIIARRIAEDFDFNVNPSVYYYDRKPFHMIYYPKKNKIGTTFSGGYGILIAPFISIIRNISIFWPFPNSLKPYYEWPPFVDALGILLGNYVYLNIMLIALFLYLRKFFSPFISFISIYSAFLGTPIIYYTFTCPSFSQFIDSFVFSIFFIFSFLYLQKSNKNMGFLYLFMAGIFFALSVFIRNNNITFIFSFSIVVFLKDLLEKIEIKKIILKFLLLFIGTLPFGALIMLYNYTQFKDPFVTGYSLHGNFILRSTLHYQLFHPVRGLFVYTPMALLMIFALIFVKRYGYFRLLSILYIILFFSLCQFFYYWTGGISYGHRFSVHLYPIYVFAIGLLLSINYKAKLKRILIYFLILLFTLYAFAHYNLYVYALATRDSRNYLFRQGDRYNPLDIAKSALVALDNVKEWKNLGNRGGLYYLNLYHYAPSLIFLPINNIYRGYLSFLWDIKAGNHADHLALDITIRSFASTSVHPRIFICQPDKRDLFSDQNLILISIPSNEVKLKKGMNILNYRFYHDKTFEIFLNNIQIQVKTPIEEAPDWYERAFSDDRIAVIFYYAFASMRNGNLVATKHYRDFKYFDIEVFQDYLNMLYHFGETEEIIAQENLLVEAY